MTARHVLPAGFRGLQLSPAAFRPAPPRVRAPLTAGAAHSWLPRCRPGQDQGKDGACAVFTIAEWAVVMQGRTITNTQRLAAYRNYIEAHNLPANSGLAFTDAYQIALAETWITGARGLQMMIDFTRLDEQPLLLGYEIDKGWEKTNDAGCIDHRADLDIVGNHAVLGVAAGNIASGPELVQFNNWWGDDWGHNGFGQMLLTRHEETIREIWRIVI